MGNSSFLSRLRLKEPDYGNFMKITTFAADKGAGSCDTDLFTVFLIVL